MGHTGSGQPAHRTSGQPEALTVASLVSEVVDHVAELVTIFEPDGTLLWANNGMTRLLGWPKDRWIGEHAAQLAHPDDVVLGLELLSSAKATGPGVKEPVVYRLAHADGGWVDVECIASVVGLDDGQYALVVSGRLAAQTRPAEAIFEEASARVAAMFDRAPVGLAQVALDGRVLRANDEFALVVGHDSGAALVDEALHDLLPSTVLSGDCDLLSGTGASHPHVQLRPGTLRGSERAVWARLASTLVDDHLGRPLYYSVQAMDVSDLVYARIELEALHDDVLRRSEHDELTGLANRARLAPWLELVADGAAALYVDLDGFKQVNDQAGHAAGDAVLAAIGKRLRAAVRQHDLAVRLGGDEFIVLCPFTGVTEATSLATRLLRTLGAPVAVDAVTHEVGASIGVATGRPKETFSSLIDRADRALYAAKDAGKGRLYVA